MSLPPGFLEDLRSRVSLSGVVGRKVVWDMRKSNMGKGDMWAPCPFHQEKSASFHVDDRKGFYYCFGCQAKGDALTFLKETENIGFMEAVEILAREAGMVMPARDPVMAQKADRRSQLAAVMEEAVKWFRLSLATGQGAAARAYLEKRRLSAEAQARFEIGYAPEGRQALFTTLRSKGIDADLIVEAGLCARPEGGGAPYDRFRDRIIFPIRDARGRAISLGGRAMDLNAPAKYLNGPQTDLFDKGRSLFNIGPARAAAGKGQPLIVAEGYMDVIALSEAGFTAAVAPLGTAVTEEQLRLMWRIHPEPVIALDGDAAGIRAGLRVIDLALPLLEAGQGLRFAMLPGGLDPDDLIRAEGAAGMARVLDAAQPMVALLWQRETEGRTFDSPERKATLDKTLRALLDRIRDPSIRGHYAQEIRGLQWQLFGRAAGTGLGPRRGAKPPPAAPNPATRASLLAMTTAEELAETLQEAVVLAVLINHPSLLARHRSEVERIDLISPDHNRLRAALLAHAGDSDPARLREILAGLVPDALESLFAQTHVTQAPGVGPDEDAERAALCLAEALAKKQARHGARREIEDAEEDIAGLADEGVTWRLSQASAARHRADRSALPDAQDMGEDRAAMLKDLQALIDSEAWIKKKG